MKITPFFLSLFLPFAWVSLVNADWPQWRGPNRDGVVGTTVTIPIISEDNAPGVLWTLDGVPSDRDGGHGSLVVSKGKVIVAIVWHRDVPTQTRQFTQKVLSDLGHRSTTNLGADLVKKMESDRQQLSRRLRGKALDDYTKQWIEDNIIDPKVKLSLGSWIGSRFKKGAAAIPLPVLDEISKQSTRIFGSQQELEAWIDEREWDTTVKQEVLSKVPTTKKEANDVILSIDAETGKQVWRFEVAGEPSGRGSSSTPAVSNGKIYAALSGHIYCVDEQSGKEIWKSSLNKKGPASSPLVANGKIYINQGRLTAFDALTGKLLWENRDVKTANSSPNLWQDLVICNSSKSLVAINADTGATVWEIDGGGDSTPVISGDHLVIASKREGKNLLAYQLAEDRIEELWSKEFIARRYGSSPIIHDGYVYHLGSSRHWCINLETGEVAWERGMQSAISSPILVDGKLLVYENRGGLLAMIRATPDDYQVLGKTKVAALYCASPAMVKRDLYIRTPNSVKCLRIPAE